MVGSGRGVLHQVICVFASELTPGGICSLCVNGLHTPAGRDAPVLGTLCSGWAVALMMYDHSYLHTGDQHQTNVHSWFPS